MLSNFYKLVITLIITLTSQIHAQSTDTEWLKGSWGITFPVFGGERLDTEVAGGYDLEGGAKEVVDNLPAVGHVITNLSYFAHSHYFTLRNNNNVDVANEIHESLVPSLENEKIIFDVLKTYKDSGKKIILYISTNYMERASDETKAAWINYYTTKFNGDEYLAYENLIQGFIELIKDYADGYWLDTTSNLNDDGKLDDLVAMIKETDPGSSVSANLDKNYFKGQDGNDLEVDTDGIEDTDDEDYRIILHEPLNLLQDFTNGHVTPLAQGAPPNSWAYEEFTIPNMVKEPVAYYQGKAVVKHGWFPIRTSWHSPRVPKLFETEQAYRFAKSITQAGASMTFANTIDYGIDNPGHMMADEMVIMQEINDRLLSENVPDYVTYTRPEGAFLVDESQVVNPVTNPIADPGPKTNFLNNKEFWYENETETNVDFITPTSTEDGSLTQDFDNPRKKGINNSNTVARFIRDGGSTARVYFDLPNVITDFSSLKISLDAYANVSDDHFSSNPYVARIRIFFINSTTGNRIYKQKQLSDRIQWENLEFDFTDQGIISEGFDQMAIGFANGDTLGSTSLYYFDNLKKIVTYLYENETETNLDYITPTNTEGGSLTQDFDNPRKKGINTSNTIARFHRDGGSTARVYFNLPDTVKDFSSLKISLDVYANVSDDHFSSNIYDARVRVFFYNSSTGNRIYKQLKLSEAREWENLEFDFTDIGIISSGFDQMAIGFANGDNSQSTSLYYFDNLKKLIATTDAANKDISVQDISTLQTTAYPNPFLDAINVQAINLEQQIGAVHLVDMNGSIVVKKDTSENDTTLDNLSELANGIYLLQIFNTQEQILKIIKVVKE